MGAAEPQSELRVEALQPGSDPRWDAYVETNPDGLVFHHSAWLGVLSAEYGQPPLALAAIGGDGALRGVLPLMATRGLPLVGRAVGGARLASLPRTPVAGPLADDADASRALVRAAIERLPDGAQLQLKPAAGREIEAGPELAGHDWRLTYVLDLPEDEEKIRFGNSRNHGRIRWAVNKAHKEGVTVRPMENKADLHAWYALYLDTMRHHAVPARPLRLFEAMAERLRPRGMMELLLAEQGGRLLAGSVLLSFGSTTFYAFNGVDRASLSLRPNEVIQWEAIHRACREGRRRYDFGEVVEQHAGLAEFKSKWGTEPVRLRRFYHPAPDEPPDPGDGEPGRVVQRAHAAWQRVPLPLTRAAGTLVYRWL